MDSDGFSNPEVSLKLCEGRSCTVEVDLVALFHLRQPPVAYARDCFLKLSEILCVLLSSETRLNKTEF